MTKFRIGQKLSLSILLLFISNLMTTITHGTETNIFMALAFIAFFIPLFLVKKELPKTILSWILLIFSVVALVDNDISNLTGYFLFLFSVSISIKPKLVYVIYFTVFISALLYKFNLLSSAPSQIMEYSAGIIFIGFIYQHYIHPRNRISKRNIDIINITQEEKAILHLWCRGYSYDDISKTLSLNILGASVRRKITSIMTDNKKNNDAQFVKWLYENV